MTLMDQDTVYSIPDHRHRFAVWAAARAAQRGWTKTAVLSEALEASGVPALMAQDSRDWPATPAQIDEVHRVWACSILKRLDTLGVSGSYGQVAKLLAIYLKTTVILAGHEDTAFGHLLHPPLDAILLRSLAADPAFPTPLRTLWRQTKWTKLDERGYFEIIESLRVAGLDQPAFWMIERYWQP